MANNEKLEPEDSSAAEQTTDSDTPASRLQPDPDRIARRAYERFQTRGGEHGRHEEDWLEAERELNTPADEEE